MEISQGHFIILSICKLLTFSEIPATPIVYTYCLGMCVNNRVKIINRILNCNLEPDPHIQYVCSKSFKFLGVIVSLARDLRDHSGIIIQKNYLIKISTK